MKTLLACCVIVLLPALLFATIIEVPQDFTDLQAAIDASSDGDTVLVGQGTYYGGFDFDGHHITLASHFIFTGDEADIEATILDGQNTDIVLTASNLGQDGVVIIGLTIQHGLGTGDWTDGHGGGIHSYGTNIHVDHCRFLDNVSAGNSSRGAGIFVKESTFDTYIGNCYFEGNYANRGFALAFYHVFNDNSLIENCIFTNNTGEIETKAAVNIGTSDWVTIKNCLIYNNLGRGLRIYNSEEATVDHCTIVDNGFTGVSVRYDASATISNSILAAPDGGAIYLEDGADVILRYLHVPDVSDLSDYPHVGCIWGDPMFRDRGDGDFHLLPGSPCINAGDPDYALDPDGTITDMGALPFISISISLNPVAYTFPSTGGELVYDARFQSGFDFGSPITFWTEVVFPTGCTMGPLTERLIYVEPFSDFTVSGLTQIVPAGAPDGLYLFRAYVGRRFQADRQRFDEFYFTKGLQADMNAGNGDLSAWFATDTAASQLADMDTDPVADLPSAFSLSPVYPNPFNESATVRISLPESGDLKVTVFDATGRQVESLQQGYLHAGTHEFSLDASNLASGVYFVRATVPGQFNDVRKAMVLR